jgi:hypothetical protein
VYLPISILFKLSKKMYVKVSIFGLLAGSVVMLAKTHYSTTMQQWLKDTITTGKIVIIANAQPMTRNTKAKQVHLRDSLSVQLNFGSLTKIMIEKITIEQEYKVRLEPPPTSPAGPKVIQGPIGSDRTQGERRFNGTQGDPALNKIEPACLYVVEGNLNSTSSDGVTPSLTSSTAMCAPGAVIYIASLTILNSGFLIS